MSEIPYIIVEDWQSAGEVHLDLPVILVCFLNTDHSFYMRYLGEFYPIDHGSYAGPLGRTWQWCNSGVWFTPDSVAWMANNSIALPFSAEDLMLYQLTWGLGRE